MHLDLPPDFILGAATSSQQIEGSPLADGAAPSIWHRFTGSRNLQSGKPIEDIAVDHYNRWREDIGLIKELEIDSYRFSIAWPRVFPDGIGKVNHPGIDFYDKLVDQLLEAGITPMATLYHWDLPLALQDRGGWTNPHSIDWFSGFADTIYRRLSDRVPYWITINEPWIVLHLGFIKGIHAPALRDLNAAANVYKNLLLAHSRAEQLMRAHNNKPSIGLSPNLTYLQPYSNNECDIEATQNYKAYQHDIFLYPWLKGKLPEIAFRLFGEAMPSWKASELEELKCKPDFLGINYYTRQFIEHDKDELLEARIIQGPEPHTNMDWEIYPEGLTNVLDEYYHRWKLPLVVTENGAAYDDYLKNGQVADQARCDYLVQHLRACENAIKRGVDLRGYYVWSLLDNVEWDRGLTQRFGLIHVDYESLERTIKKSGYLYRDIIRKHHEKALSDSDHHLSKGFK